MATKVDKLLEALLLLPEMELNTLAALSLTDSDESDRVHEEKPGHYSGATVMTDTIGRKRAEIGMGEIRDIGVIMDGPRGTIE